jgi:cytochrome c biogenesis protein
MRNLKCECGHVNPEGTVLCEACGKPIEQNQHIDGNNDGKLINMRYEGSARRSKTRSRTLIDKIWIFFSSVKVGVWIIILTLIASGIGTIYPQEMYIPPTVDPATHYEDQYGFLGKIYYELGFHNLYSSWWYLLLVASLGISLVICSIDRFVPLYRALKRQKAKRHDIFIERQRIFGENKEISKEDRTHLIEQLKKHRYKIVVENGHVLAEKGRFSRWGPYVNHIGLIIILIAALLRSLPSMYVEDYVWVREGETQLIPYTDQEYYIRNDDFILEVYDENDERYKDAIQKMGSTVASNFQTNATIFKAIGEHIPGQEPELEEVQTAEIRVNKPLQIDEVDIKLYQTDYQINEFQSMTFTVHAKGNEEEKIGEFTFDMNAPQEEYDLGNGYRIEVNEYYPEFYMNDKGEPASFSKYPKNPAFIFFVYGPDIEKYEVNFIGIGTNLNPDENNKYEISISNLDLRDVTGLTVKRDHTLPIFALGAIIFMIGVVQGMYWQHRRIWIHPKGDGVWIAAHTNKNWFGLKKEIAKMIENTNINMPEDQQEKA